MQCVFAGLTQGLTSSASRRFILWGGSECVDVDESESAKARKSAKKMLQQEKEEDSDSEAYSRWGDAG